MRGARIGALVLTTAALALGALGCEGRPRAGGSEAVPTEAPRRTGPAVAVLDFSGGVPEQEAPSLFGQVGRKKSFDELLRTIEEISGDPKKGTVGVLVKFGGASIGAARA